MLIEHHLGHFNKAFLLVFNNAFYQGTHKAKTNVQDPKKHIRSQNECS